MTIFSVHLNYYSECDNYVPWCYATTTRNNPASECFFLTSSADLKVKLEDYCRGLPNARIILLEPEFTKTAIDDVESIFYHDEINSKWFDLYSFARHVIVDRFIRGNASLSKIETFATTDSDIAHFYDYSDFLQKPRENEVYTRSPIISYFAIWHRTAFQLYSSIPVMDEYFRHAASVKGRCSDMHLLEWILTKQYRLNRIWDQEEFGIALDTLRDFFYYSGAWLNSSPYSSDYVINQFPNGIWNGDEMLSIFSSEEFFSSLLCVCTQARSSKRLFLKKQILARMITRLRGLSKLGFDPQSYYALWSEWIYSNTWQPYLSLNTDLIPVPYVHFQGSTKRIAPIFASFTDGIRD
jgi:hypothetical protein